MKHTPVTSSTSLSERLGRAVALKARHVAVPCHIVVPTGAPLADERGRTFCHPYDDPVIVAGQASLETELQDMPGAVGRQRGPGWPTMLGR